ncbi:MAG: hypothetical protein A2Y13_00685 [Planctomycetes bacterium GWC2_45_44]|nr:MAG: hypothetical protein A2Y13_00685 [Planctomycetes bacterium GWC2_45_44]HBR18998.1 hypothetical protein [Phycisphaerales bacterium]
MNTKVEIMSLADRAASSLRDEIRSGKYAVGQKIDDEHALADKFGISRGTVRQALELLRKERLVVRQQGRGTFVTNPAEAPVADTKTALLGIMAYEKEYYFRKIIQGASSRATNRGYMLVTGSNSTPAEIGRYTDVFLKNSIRGVAVTPVLHDSQHNYEPLIKANIPMVLLDRMLPDRQEDFVSVDDYQGTYMATRYLVGLGHTKIAYIGTDTKDDIPCQPRRYHGFVDACNQSGLNLPEEWRLEIHIDEHGQISEESLYNILRQKQRPTAFVTFCDLFAVRIIDVAKKLNIKVPEELSVVGFDDSALCQNYDIPVTSIHPQYEEIGRVLIDLLIDGIESSEPRPKRSVLIAPQLVIRKSTAPPPQSSGNI